MANTLMRFHSRYRAMGLAVAAALGMTCGAAADTWDNSSGDDLWSTNANWVDNTQPTNSDPVIFPSPIPPPGHVDITLSAGEQAQSLTFNAPVQTLTGGLSGATLNLSGGSISVASSAFANVFVPISGSAGLSKTGGGYLHLNTTGTGGSSYTGGVTISGGTLRISTNGDLGNAANGILISGGALETGTAPGLATSRVITVGALGTRIHTVGTGSVFTVNSGLSDGGFSNPLTVTGDGNLVLTASSTRSGNTYIDGGHVRLTNGAALGTGGDIISNNGSLEIAGGITHSNIIFLQSNGILRSGGVGAVHNNTILVQASGSQVFLNGGPNAGDTLQLGGPASNMYTGGSGAKTVVNGAGRVTILTASNEYAGDWQIDSGMLRPTGGLSLGTGTSPVVVNNTGTLQLFSVTFDRGITLNSGSTLAFELGGQSYGTHTIGAGAAVGFAFKGAPTFGEILGDAPNDLTGGSGASIQVSSDTAGNFLILNQPSDYAGAWSIGPLAGVRITDANALGTDTSPVVLFNNASPNGGTLEIGGVTLARNITMLNGSTLRGMGSASVTGTVAFNLFGTVTLATSASGDTFTIGDAPDDYTSTSSGFPFTTTVSGPGTVILPFANNYAGDWSIDSGTLRIGDGAALGTGTSAIPINNPATLELAGAALGRAIVMNGGSALRGTGFAQTTGTITVSTGAQAMLASGAALDDVLMLVDDPLVTNELTGGAGGSNITVRGAGTVALTTSSNYTGGWMLESGTLQIAMNNNLGASTNSVTLAGGTLHFAGQAGAVTRPFTANGGGLRIGGPFVTLVGPLISGVNGGFTKSGTGVLTISGMQNHAPGAVLQITEGTVNLTAAAGSASEHNLTVNVDGGTLNMGTTQYVQAFHMQDAGGLGAVLGGTVPGTDYAQLIVNTNAALAGTLNITRTGGFEPQLGDSFVIITCASRTGTFQNVTGMAAGPGKVFRVQYNSSDVTLIVGEPAPADLSADGYVDGDDLALFTFCNTRDSVPHDGSPLCQEADFDADGDVDANDFGVYQRCISGANAPADPACTHRE